MKQLINLCLSILFLMIGSQGLAQGDDFTYTIVGGKEEPVTYDDQVVDGVTITNFTYRSRYPLGFEFTATITPPDDADIERVTLFYSFATDTTTRALASPTANENEWVAVPYSDRGLPPWHEIDAFWRIQFTDGSFVDSRPVHAVYYDASREWYRAENDYVLVYWYGMPVELGKAVLDAIEETQPRYLEGFGELLPYRPLAVIFPPGPDWLEYRAGNQFDDTQTGSSGTIISEAGSTIQRVRTLEPAEIRADCIWNEAVPSLDYQINRVAGTVSHEIAHLYQQELGINGPTWWIEGQAKFFQYFDEYPIDERLRQLAELRNGDFPSFQGDGPGGGAFTAVQDGCTHLIYDMGASFMNWIVDNYGGLETYRAIVDELTRGRALDVALENVTGFTLLELENGWRAYLGVGPVPAEVLDPGAILSEPVDPLFDVGDTLVLETANLREPLYNKPAEDALATSSCFGNSPLTILRAGNDGRQNWYEIDCQGLTGWITEGILQ